MSKSRLEFFSDGVMAIMITIMVIEIGKPNGDHLQDFMKIVPEFLTYLLSFIYVGIYWNNHHHLLHTIRYANGRILITNLHFLFWLSLLPFATRWMGAYVNSVTPTMFYGAILTMVAIAYYMLQIVIMSYDKEHTLLEEAIGKDFKGKFTIAIGIIGTLMATLDPSIAQGIYLLIAFIWARPDKRIEKRIEIRTIEDVLKEPLDKYL